VRIRAAAGTDIGRARERNEDAFLLRDPLFAVADGMGGHRGGEVASTYALEVIGGRAAERGDGAPPPLPGLVSDVEEANQRVLARGEADHDLRGMGTTLTAVVTDNGRGYVVHVGDSRAYLLRDGALQQLTEDHTLVQRMVREGKLTPDEAGRHPHRSILTRALGVEDDLTVDELTLDLHPGDRLLLCTDGLTSMVDGDRIAEILRQEPDPEAACARLIEAANGAGGDDNITVVILDVLDDDADAEGGDADAARTDTEAPAATTGGAAAPAQTTYAAVATAEPDTSTRTFSVTQLTGEPPRRRPIRWTRLAMMTGVIALVLLAAVLGVRAYIDRQWYVGDSNGAVAIYNGVPTQVLGFHLSHVTETSDVPTDRALSLRTWQGLRDGITAESLEDARAIVRQIETDVRAGVEPAPTPSPSPSGG
jgi:protein phosphatase